MQKTLSAVAGLSFAAAAAPAAALALAASLAAVGAAQAQTTETPSLPDALKRVPIVLQAADSADAFASFSVLRAHLDGGALMGDSDDADGNSGDSGKKWSVWGRGAWNQTKSGRRKKDGLTLSFAGKTYAGLIGHDRQYGAMRAGLAIARTRTKLQADFFPGHAVVMMTTAAATTAVTVALPPALNDEAVRQLDSLFPYIEWHTPRAALHLAAGLGGGYVEITGRDGMCDAKMDAAWRVARASGDYRLFTLDDVFGRLLGRLTGEVSYAESTTDAGFCRGDDATPIAAAEAKGGEWSLGGRIEYEATDVVGFRLVPYAGAAAGYSFDDVSDSREHYDVLGGFLASAGNFSFGADGETKKINNAHTRHTGFSGWVAYTGGGGVRSSFRLANSGGADGLAHRWQIAANAARGKTRLAGEIYAEQAADAPASLGAQARFTF